MTGRELHARYSIWSPPYSVDHCAAALPPFLLQYYDDSFPALKEQLKFEESLFQKTQRANGVPHSHCIYTAACQPPPHTVTALLILLLTSFHLTRAQPHTPLSHRHILTTHHTLSHTHTHTASHTHVLTHTQPHVPTHEQPHPYTRGLALCSLSSSPLLLPVAEIIMHDGVTAVYRSNVDLFFYVLGSQSENEVVASF